MLLPGRLAERIAEASPVVLGIGKNAFYRQAELEAPGSVGRQSLVASLMRHPAPPANDV
jgi:hypothetical protein